MGSSTTSCYTDYMADILSQEELDALLSQMKEDSPDSGSAPTGSGSDNAAVATVAPEDSSLAESVGDAGAALDMNVGMILNIPVKIQAEIGRARMAIGEILDLCQGSVIELDHLASEYIDLTVNDKVMAQGEAIVVNENFGFRVIEVDSVRERINKL